MPRRTDFTPSPALQALLDAQCGLVTAAQAHAVGYGPKEVERLRSTRVLTSVRRGVYAFSATYGALAPEARHIVDTQAALLRLHPPATLSHETAALWSDLPLLRPNLDRVHVSRPDLPASRREAGIHHHPGALPDSHVTESGGAVLTKDARTAVDIARTNDFYRGLAAVDSALRRGTSPEELQAVMEFCRAWPGACQASRAVAWGDPRAANPAESWSRGVFIEGGIPPSHLQFAVYDVDGLIGYADVAWYALRVLGECDGRLKYAVPPGADPGEAGRIVWEEKRREDRFRAAGWEVVRWGWADLYDPRPLWARVLAAAARAAVRLGATA